MPDYDKVHFNISGPYQKPYKELCADTAPKKVADDLLIAIIKTLKYSGDPPALIIIQTAERWKLVSGGPMFANAVDWEMESKNIDKLIQQATHSNQYGLGIAKRICKRQLQELQNGLYPLDLTRMMIQDYVWEVYKASFEEKAPRKSEHYNGVDHKTVATRLAEIRPHLSHSIDQLAEQIIQHQGVSALRRPPRRRERQLLPDIFTEDICEISL